MQRVNTVVIKTCTLVYGSAILRIMACIMNFEEAIGKWHSICMHFSDFSVVFVQFTEPIITDKTLKVWQLNLVLTLLRAGVTQRTFYQLKIDAKVADL